MNLYPKTKAEMMRGNINLVTANVRVVLVDTDVYTYNDTHAVYNDLSGVVGTETDVLTNPTVSDAGVYDADDTTLPLVVGNESEALVLFIDLGDPALDMLLGYIDSGTGLPYIPQGLDVPVKWNENGIFKL